MNEGSAVPRCVNNTANEATGLHAMSNTVHRIQQAPERQLNSTGQQLDLVQDNKPTHKSSQLGQGGSDMKQPEGCPGQDGAQGSTAVMGTMCVMKRAPSRADLDQCKKWWEKVCSWHPILWLRLGQGVVSPS